MFDLRSFSHLYKLCLPPDPFFSPHLCRITAYLQVAVHVIIQAQNCSYLLFVHTVHPPYISGVISHPHGRKSMVYKTPFSVRLGRKLSNRGAVSYILWAINLMLYFVRYGRNYGRYYLTSLWLCLVLYITAIYRVIRQRLVIIFCDNIILRCSGLLVYNIRGAVAGRSGPGV